MSPHGRSFDRARTAGDGGGGQGARAQRQRRRGALELQRTIGNQAVAAMIQSGVLPGFDASVTPDNAGAGADAAPAPNTRHAPQAAHHVLQRKCACERSGMTCDRCAAERRDGPLQRQSSVGLRDAVTDLPAIVREVLASPGQPLDHATRAYMEPRFGRSFSDVRVHTDARASASARAINANAYTVGTQIAFDTGRYASHSDDGRRLIAHELTHVVQQSAGGIAPTERHEAEADAVAEQVVAGHPVTAASAAGPGLQREEKDDVPAIVGNPILNSVMGHLPLGTASRVATSAVLGLGSGLVEELKGPTGKLLLARLATFESKDVKPLSDGYTFGLIEGLISPITDLFGLARFGEQLQAMATSMAIGVFSGRTDLVQELRDLDASLTAAKNALKQSFTKMRESPVKTIETLLALPEKISIEAPKSAYRYGLDGGKSIAKSLLEPWEGKKKKEENKQFTFTGAISDFGESLKDKIVDVPWAIVGNKIGYAVGAAVINVAMLFLSEGIGNAIVKGANALSKISESMGAFSRGVKEIAEVMRVTGSAIGEVEALIDAAMTKLLKPLEPIIEPIMKPFAEFIDRLKGFLKKLMGAVEKESAQAGKAAAAEGAKLITDKPVHPPGHAGSDLPKKPAPSHSPATHETPSGAQHGPAHSESSGAPAHETPASTNQVDDAAKTTEAMAAGPPMVQKPASEGHHVQVSERGVEVCSPPPCPLLNVEFAKELEADPKLAESWETIEKLRKSGSVSDTEKAAELAAQLQKNLTSIRARERIFSSVKLSPTQRGRLEKTLEAAERYGATMTDEGAGKLIGRLQGKSEAEIDAALGELEKAATDLPGSYGDLKDRGGADPVGKGPVADSPNKPGTPNTAAPKSEAKGPPGFEDMASDTPTNVRKGPGNKQQNPALTVGNEVHTHYEEMPQWVRDDIDRVAFPEGGLPHGLEKEVEVPDTRLAPGRRPRMDRVDRANGIIYEIGPAGSKAQKLAEAQGYAELMNRFEKRSDGSQWVGEVRTYDGTLLKQFAKDIGWIE